MHQLDRYRGWCSRDSMEENEYRHTGRERERARNRNKRQKELLKNNQDSRLMWWLWANLFRICFHNNNGNSKSIGIELCRLISLSLSLSHFLFPQLMRSFEWFCSLRPAFSASCFLHSFYDLQLSLCNRQQIFLPRLRCIWLISLETKSIKCVNEQ